MTDMLQGLSLLFRRTPRAEEARATIAHFLAALSALAHRRHAPPRRRAAAKEVA